MTPTPLNARVRRTASGFAIALALALFPAPAVAGNPDTPPTAPAEDRFAGLRVRLSDQADDILLRATTPAPLQSGSDPTAVQRKPAAVRTIDDMSFERFAQRFWNGQEHHLRRAVKRVSELRPVVDPILRDEGLPPAILALVLVESGGDPSALSIRGARGLWQFMPATARRYGLKVEGRDERLDVERATRAAARHLRGLHERFGSWPLALAAYNAGQGAVERAVARAQTTDFATLSSLRLLPAETRAYVPAVLAATALFEVAELGKAEGPSIRKNVVYAEPLEASGGAR